MESDLSVLVAHCSFERLDGDGYLACQFRQGATGFCKVRFVFEKRAQ